VFSLESAVKGKLTLRANGTLIAYS